MTSARRLLRLALETDQLAERTDTGWIARCIHCRSRLQIDEPIDAQTAATLEHIVPKSWFGLSAALPLLSHLSGPDDPRNIAVACGRCNHSKGVGPDAKGPGDAEAFDVIRRLAMKRMETFRPSGRE